MAVEKINYVERRKRFVETFQKDPVLISTLPKLTADLFAGEFGVSIDDLSLIPITWSVGMGHLLKFIHSQNAEEFAVTFCGFTIQYTTEYSQSDKARNIVPELYHDTIPIFTKKDHRVVPGSSYNQELLRKYNEWRTVNLTEILDKLERDTFTEVQEKFGLSLQISATVTPLMAAIYAAAVQIALDTKQQVNLYNWFTIDVRANDKIILTPLASIKQGLKDDSKRQ